MKKMNQKIKLIMVALGLLMAFAGVGSQQAKASKMPNVPNNYSFDYTKLDSGPIPYYPISKTTNAYLWNYTHTRKIHNLKSYPNTIWLVTNANVKWFNGQKVVYYKIYSAYNHKVKGLIWSGYLAKCFAKDPKLFNSDVEYLKYVNSDPSQAVTRKLAKLFPNSKISLNLSQYVSSAINQKPELKGFTDYKDLSRTISYDDYRVQETPTQVVSEFSKQLEQAGYSTNKRNSMDNYSIGIAIVYNAEYAESSAIYKYLISSPYPIMHKKYYDDNSTTFFFLAIAKNE